MFKGIPFKGSPTYSSTYSNKDFRSSLLELDNKRFTGASRTRLLKLFTPIYIQTPSGLPTNSFTRTNYSRYVKFLELCPIRLRILFKTFLELLHTCDTPRYQLLFSFIILFYFTFTSSTKCNQMVFV